MQRRGGTRAPFGALATIAVAMSCGGEPRPPPPNPPPAKAAPPPGCLAPSPAPAGTTATLTDGAERAWVAIDDRSACRRRYVLTTTAKLRDEQPPNPRAFVEATDAPTLRTNHDLFDALYALALEDARQASVAEIHDGAFDDGRPVACPEGGCFETGRLWTYVWTRDTSYATHLALGALDPTRAKNSLEYKLSERRTGGDLQIVQDTGSGGSYPISTDRVAWALGAREVLAYLRGAERSAFEARAFEAIRNTIEHDRRVVFDASDGLYTGEQSFLDWREQTYPPWTAKDTVRIGTSKALSTNTLHLRILEIGSELARARGDDALAKRYRAWADALRAAIGRAFWLPERGMLAAFALASLDPAPSPRYDLLGASLAVLADVVEPERARRVIAGYPLTAMGPAVVWPQQPNTPVYHNRAFWPFVTAYFARAARHVGNDAAVARAVTSLVRGAALNLSNMENFELVSGQPAVDDGGSVGPVINSQRQLWSVAGYVSMVHDVLFGLETSPEGIRFRPYIPRLLRSSLFSSADRLVLNDFPYGGKKLTLVLRLPPAGAVRTGAYSIGAERLDGSPIGEGFLAPASLAPRSTLEIDLVDAADRGAGVRTVEDLADRRALYGPHTPSIVAIAPAAEPAGAVRLDVDRAGERAEDVVLNVYRDGARVAARLAGATTSWTDRDAGQAGASPCYAIETEYIGSGNVSQRSLPRCFLGVRDANVQTIDQRELRVSGATSPAPPGRAPGSVSIEPGRDVEVPSFRAKWSGEHLLSLVAANGSGPINTGVTCAVRMVTVSELPAGDVVAEGVVFAPHTGGWDVKGESSPLRVSLVAGRSYRVRIHDGPVAVNMSAFRHFEHYTGGSGGAKGPVNRMDVSAVRLVLRRRL